MLVDRYEIEATALELKAATEASSVLASRKPASSATSSSWRELRQIARAISVSRLRHQARTEASSLTGKSKAGLRGHCS
jgi:hypothetical protein